MKNPFASLFHSLLERFRRPRRIPRELALSPEQFRELLIETLDDPATARSLARRLLLPVFPMQGGACSIPPSDIQAGTFDCPGNYAFTGGNVGIGTTSPSFPLTVTKSTTNAGTTRVSVDSPTTVTANGTNYNIGIANSLTNQALSSGVTDSGYRLACRNDVYVNNTSFAGTLGSQTALEARAGMYNVAETARINYVYAGFFHIFNGYGGQGGTIGAAFGVRISSDSGPGTFTNKWDLYAASPDAKNYFAGNVGIGTTSPQAKLHVQSGDMSSDFYGTAAVETTGNTDFNLIAGASSIASLNFGDTDGNVGKIEYNHANDSMRFHTNAAERMRINSDGDVGIGRSTPQAKLHVKGGGVSIEDTRGAGRLGFVHNGEDDPRTVLYRGGSDEAPDITILRNFPPSTPPEPEDEVLHTLLKIWAPLIKNPETQPPPSTSREATLALVRDLTYDSDADQEFLDLYNNGYSTSTQFGIRIQKRGTGQYRDFVFDESPAKGTYIPIMMLKASRSPRSVGIGAEDRLSKLTIKGPASFSATGTVAINGTVTVTGTNTVFTQEVGIGDRVTISGQTRTVTVIGSDTGLTVDSAFSGTQSGLTMTVMTSLFRADDSSGNVQLIVSDQGKVGLGTATPANTLEVKAGGTTLADAWTTRSSIRWKRDVRPLEGALDKVRNLRGVSFEWKATGRRSVGLISEEVEAVVPEAVAPGDDGQGSQGVDYGRLVALLVEAIKEQQEQLRDLRRMLETRSEGTELGPGSEGSSAGRI